MVPLPATLLPPVGSFVTASRWVEYGDVALTHDLGDHMLVDLLGSEVLAHGGQGPLLLLTEVLQAQSLQLAQHPLQQRQQQKVGAAKMRR